MFLPELVQGISFSFFDKKMTVSYFKSFLFKSFDDFWFGVFLINSKVAFGFVESYIRWEDILCFQQGFLDIFEWNGLLFLNSKSENDWFYFIVGIIWSFVFFFRFDFLLGFEFWKIIKWFSSDHSFISIEFELIIINNGIDNLLDFVDSEFFDFVAVKEEWQFDKVVFVGGNFFVEEFIVSEVFVTEVIIDLLGDGWRHVYVIDCKQQLYVI